MSNALHIKRGPPLVGDSIPLLTSKTSATAEAWGKKSQPYKSLPTRFQHHGFDYRQIAREEKAAIYEQRWTGCAEQSLCYEIIRIRPREGFQIGGRFIEPSEVYPNSEAWGVAAWTVRDKEAAFRKFREMAT